MQSRIAEKISIHAPRTGSDPSAITSANDPDDFNPRSPHGERHQVIVFVFQAGEISIHAPRTGSDFNEEAEVW